MRAVVMREFGEADVLISEEVLAPAARPGWVTVNLEASALNWHDVLVRQGVYGSPLPLVMGADGAGTRTDTGEPVVVLPSLGWGADESAPAPGWQILGDFISGTYAEQVIVPEECAVPRLPGHTAEQAAAFGLVGLTTYRALFTRGRLRKGESLLVLGASGGIATTAVQLAGALGALPFVTSASAGKVAAAQELGAIAGFDHSCSDWYETARAASPGGRGFDLVLDMVGRWNESVRTLRPGGRCVVAGGSVSTEALMDVRHFYFGQFDLLGTTMGSPWDMAELRSFAEECRVPPPVIDSRFSLDDAAAAHRRLESGVGVGKVVLRTA